MPERILHRAVSEPWWIDLPREELLQVRLCDLDVAFEGTWVEHAIARVRFELSMRGLAFRPRFELGAEWMCPDGTPSVVLPFYLVHPRLCRLERHMVQSVEGLGRAACARLLRHEVGHALENAYRLARTRLYQRAFGTRRPYPRAYRPDPKSRAFVCHLPDWYAQSHPAEDFAETFAVWLTPRKRWMAQYEGWGALNKLLAVDRLMGRIEGAPPALKTKRCPEKLSTLTMTLGEHYAAKRARYGVEAARPYDSDLRQLFTSTRPASAASFIDRTRGQILEHAEPVHWNERWALSNLLNDMQDRCRGLKLRLGRTRALPQATAEVLTHHMHANLRGRDLSIPI